MAGPRGQVPDLGAAGDPKLERLTLRPVALRSFAMRSATSPVLAPVPERGQVPETAIGNDHDVTPTPSVTAVGSSARDMGLAPEADTAVSAGARFNVDCHAVVKHQANFLSIGVEGDECRSWNAGVQRAALTLTLR
jgi:hypothetical protein